MKTLSILLLLVVLIGLCASVGCVDNSNNSPSKHVSIPQVANKVREGDNATAKCILCGLVMNEIEGLLVENMTEDAIQFRLFNNVCVYLGFLKLECDKLVENVPEFITRIVDTNSVSRICVEDGYCEEPFTPFPDPRPVPTYVINLDALPGDRWKAVCSNVTYKQQLQIIIDGFTSLFGILSSEISLAGKTINTLYFPIEYAAEIRACADDLDVDFGWLTILNMIYEVVGACTSIVSQTVDNKILHVRNMDFWDGIWLTNHLKNVTFTAEFHSLGKVKFYSTNFVGYMGIFSGMKPSAFSISIDTRRVGLTNITEYVKRLISDVTHRNASLVTFLSRKTLTEATSYTQALSMLSNSAIAGDAYYILGGVSSGQGAVITRNPVNATDIWRLDTSVNRWYEVETNYDHWGAAPWFDDRIIPANNAMNALGRPNLSLNNLLKAVLSVKPVLNIQTTFSMLACPATGQYTTYARYCPYPCAE